MASNFKIFSPRALPILAFLIIMVSCETYQNLDNTPSDPKMVIFGEISPSSSIAVKIDQSISALDEFDKDGDSIGNSVTDADVSLFENGNFISKLQFKSYYNGNGYFSDYVPKIGYSYRIEVTHDDYLNVQTETDIRQTNGKLDGAVNYITEINSDGTYQEGFVRTKIVDPPGQNFYELKLMQTSYDIIQNNGNPTYEKKLVYLTNNFMPIPLSNGTIYDEYSGLKTQRFLISDESFDGKSFIFEIPYGYYRYDANLIRRELEIEPDTALRVELREISYELYTYIRSIEYHMGTSGNNFIEPVRIYSNVHNGYGVFGAYNSVIKEAKLALEAN